MNQQWEKRFRKPDAIYRGAPFWAWNGKLEPEELRRQVRVMEEMGLGGFFMHSRVGLDTPYMEEEWMDCIKACLEEGKARGMRCWLYDEDRWPSGAAGGIVTQDPAYRQRRLVARHFAKPGDFSWSKNIQAAFRVVLDKNYAIQNSEKLTRGKKPSRLNKGECLVAFESTLAPCSSWYNGYTYLDTLNPKAVQAFIASTHQRYADRFPEEMGGAIPGMFTDEPNFGGYALNPETQPQGQLLEAPWTDNLPKVFKQRYGYALEDKLLDIFFQRKGQPFTHARWAFHDCVTHLFVEAFARQIGQWCEENKLEHTGHVLCEHSLYAQTAMVGSAMRFYEYMQAPGMDLLTAYSREYDTAKQVSSAARQFGAKWRLTETYGCTGWDFPFAGHKALGDWQAALGINFRCQHLSWYTMEGEAKRDYPAAIFYQSPWWEHYKKVEDYFGRVNLALSEGKEVRDILVLHPVESTWVTFYVTEEKRVHGLFDEKTFAEAIQKGLWQLRDSLLANHLDFDYADEDILARHGQTGRSQGKALLKVGQAQYRAVVVPPLKTIRSSTLEILQRFAEMGGTVIFAGPAPKAVDAEPSDKAQIFSRKMKQTSRKGAGLVKALEDFRRVSIRDEQDQEIRPALYQLREDRQGYYLFVCNIGHDPFEKMYHDRPLDERNLSFPEVIIQMPAEQGGNPLELDLESGDVLAARGNFKNYAWEIRTSLPALGSRLFYLPKKEHPRKTKPRPVSKLLRAKELNPVQWDCRLSEPNVLVLNKARYRLGQGKWQGQKEILQLDDAVRDQMKLERRGGAMVQPWAREKKDNEKSLEVELEYRFQCDLLPRGETFLALERPLDFDISLNGMAVSKESDSGWWVDKSLRRLPLDPAAFVPGENRLQLKLAYKADHPGLEVIYLLGNFGVKITKAGEKLTAPAEGLKTGSVTGQGLPFYSGHVLYETALKWQVDKGQRLCLHLPEYAGAAVRVLLDGQAVGILAWPPNEIDLTPHLTGEKQRLTLEVLGNRRNSHGPFYLKNRRPVWTGPGEYRPFHPDYDAREIHHPQPLGLLKNPVLRVYGT